MLRLDKFRSGKIESVLIMGLFALFVISVFFLVFIGVKQYQSSNDILVDNYSHRNSLEYFTELIEINDISGNITVTQIEDSNVLSISYKKDNTDRILYVYEYSDSLREFDTEKNQEFLPEKGTKTLSLTDFYPELVSASLLKISYTDSEGNSHSIHFNLHSEKGKEVLE